MSFSTMSEAGAAGTILARAPVVPVLTIPEVSMAVPLARALVDGGLPVLEVTLRTPAGLDAIRAIAEAVPDALVGAGTVCCAADFQAAGAAGSRFIVSPGISDGLFEAARRSAIPLIPGVATASELMRARDAGFDHLKFFPAEASGGVAALRALAGPFPDVRFCPTGGISLANLESYLALPAVVTVGGSWMVPADLVAKARWSEIGALAASAAEAVRAIRGAL